MIQSNQSPRKDFVFFPVQQQVFYANELYLERDRLLAMKSRSSPCQPSDPYAAVRKLIKSFLFLIIVVYIEMIREKWVQLH